MGFGPGGINCDDVIKDVFLYLDDESDAAMRNRIRDHLDDCGPCLRQFGIEQDVKSLIARCCGADVAPSGLRNRIRVRITEISVEIAHSEYLPE
ncbi:mycothiol system anti-sigma-R factor [Frankineae bacterium MT45]|uniref:mycothiol system anti-sigma-R factor n=1 Tax=Jatrophihabitans sp. GAS493 TaxID=1907575 RepID=UPI00087C4A1C|nr:mycothiol system anti-sigma-R factor [Frankineae bacterium MT45]